MVSFNDATTGTPFEPEDNFPYHQRHKNLLIRIRNAIRQKRNDVILAIRLERYMEDVISFAEQGGWRTGEGIVPVDTDDEMEVETDDEQ